MGWCIALGVLALLSIIPVGISLIYNEDGLFLSLLFGAVKIQLFPQKKKNKPVEKKKKKPAKASDTVKPKAQKEKRGGKLSDFMPLVEVALGFLNGLRRKLRIKRLELEWTMAAEDPCDLALSYAKAWTAVGNLLPLLERIFVIKKKNIQVRCDFMADTSRVLARLDVTVTVGRLICLAVRYGVLAIKEFLKLRKGGAVS